MNLGPINDLILVVIWTKVTTKMKQIQTTIEFWSQGHQQLQPKEPRSTLRSILREATKAT
jgi:hypothetical protein